jgi:hypothetical protein
MIKTHVQDIFVLGYIRGEVAGVTSNQFISHSFLSDPNMSESELHDLYGGDMGSILAFDLNIHTKDASYDEFLEIRKKIHNPLSITGSFDVGFYKGGFIFNANMHARLCSVRCRRTAICHTRQLYRETPASTSPTQAFTRACSGGSMNFWAPKLSGVTAARLIAPRVATTQVPVCVCACVCVSIANCMHAVCWESGYKVRDGTSWKYVEPSDTLPAYYRGRWVGVWGCACVCVKEMVMLCVVCYVGVRRQMGWQCGCGRLPLRMQPFHFNPHTNHSFLVRP